MGQENGTKGNAGDFGRPPPSAPRPRRRRPANDGGARIIVALLAGAGGAFVLALFLLMARLEADEARHGLHATGVGGARGVDDALEAAGDGAAPADRRRRGERLALRLRRAAGAAEGRLRKFDRLFGLPPGHPLDVAMRAGEAQLAGLAGGQEGGEGQDQEGGDVKDVAEVFQEALERDKEKETRRKEKRAGKAEKKAEERRRADADAGGEGPPHLHPLFPPMPPHTRAVDLFGEQILADTLAGRPTVAGVVAVLQRFLGRLHALLVARRDAKTPDEVIAAYFALVARDLAPLEDAYRGRPVFPVREDGSIFMSLGAYRDHLLGETLRQAFKTAAHPERLFVGAVVQNCFGLGVTCRTGVEVKGKDAHGRPRTQVSDRGPDVNGVEQFCADPDYVQYCESGQIRALYVNETESNGPTTARYFASKLWGGETYFLQADAHLRFAPEWDLRYAAEVKAARAYPKAVLSAYPPGFSEGDPPYQGGSRGTRLCTCAFSDSDVEHKILRINTGNMCRGEEAAPTQIAYIAAGFFFARAEFLVDVPFDPYLPWCFMGEEIALSLRAWTHGWDIYAPRQNLIAHQYRPGRMGLPKFWENTGRVFGRPGPGFNTQLQTITIQRIKYMVGYKESSRAALEGKGVEVVLSEFEHYGPGDVRTMPEFLDHVNIDLQSEKCGHIDWCNDCTLE